MAKGSTTSSKMQESKGFSYTSVLVGLLAVGGAYFYFDRTSSLNQFSSALTEKLCDKFSNHEASPTEETGPAPPKLIKESLYNPSLAGGKSYDPKDAMEVRYEKLHDICNKYSDVMRPESLMSENKPVVDSFQWEHSRGIALCTPYGVGKKAFEALFMRLRDADDNSINGKMTALRDNFDGAHKGYKKAVIVRHPMERLLSIYRKHFAAYTDASKQGQTNDEDAYSFPDFVQLVVNGPKQLAEFIHENQLEGQSLGIDTGMVDAKGMSKKWDSYWHQCGLCNSAFNPHFVLHFEHAKEDEEVLIELMGNKENGKKWLGIERKSYVSNEEVIKHFYSQLTKEEIQSIYEKYRVDFELFGYSPDYFLQFGQ